MTRPYRFLVGLGDDMIGYLFPPGNFVGGAGETDEQPWTTYEATGQNGGNDRFGQGHADDAESVGPHGGLSVMNALASLLAQQGRGSTVLPGLYQDASGHLSNGPFPAGSFSGAVGVEVQRTNGSIEKLLIGHQVRGQASGHGGSPAGGSAEASDAAVTSEGTASGTPKAGASHE